MATTVTNKTHKPLSISLSRGKKLRLGPGQSGDIASNDIELPAVKALVEDGTLEVVQGRGRAGAGGSEKGGRASQGFASGVARRGGDR